MAAGGCRVQAVGGLQRSHTVITNMYIFKYNTMNKNKKCAYGNDLLNYV